MNKFLFFSNVSTLHLSHMSHQLQQLPEYIIPEGSEVKLSMIRNDFELNVVILVPVSHCVLGTLRRVTEVGKVYFIIVVTLV